MVIAAPPAAIHPFVSNLRKWQEWAVWTKELDPQVKNTWSGPEEGVGAGWAWLGPKMGRGKIVVTASDVATGVKLDEAIEGDEINAHATFSYVVVGASTRVVWVDEGTLPPVLGGYFRGMIEKMLGENFEKGLEKLKSVVEAAPPPAPTPVPAPAPGAEADAGVVTDAGTSDAGTSGAGTSGAGTSGAGP